MKKIVKRMLAVLMIAVTFMGFTVNAVEITTNGQVGTVDTSSKLVTAQATLTVSNVQSSEKFSAYKILDVFYNEGNNTITYEFTKDFDSFRTSSQTYSSLSVDQYLALSGTSIETPNSSKREGELDKLASEYAAYVKKSGSSVQSGVALNTSGDSATATVAAGAYLILPTATTRVFGVMVGNVTPARGDDGEWKIEGTSIVAKATAPTVKKTVGDDVSSTKSYSYGETITYNIEVTVPAYPTDALNKKFVLTDTMSEYLVFSGFDNMVMLDGGTSLSITHSDEKNATVSTSDKKEVAKIVIDDEKHTMTIDFTIDNITSNKISISYDTTLSNQAPLGTKTPITNSVGEGPDPTPDPGTTETKPDEDEGGKTTVTTYGIKLIKYDSKDTSTDKKTNVLKGAGFKLCSTQDCESPLATNTTDDQGVIEFKGIKAGTYYLIETKAPTGYSLIKNPIVVQVNENTQESTAKYDSESGMVEVLVSNTLVGSLPVTGGAGTILFTVSGAIIMIGAIWFIFIYKKKNKEAQS